MRRQAVNLITPRDEQAVGNHTFSAANIMRSDAIKLAAKAMPQPVLAVLLARLAVSQREQDRGFGKHPLRDAIAGSQTRPRRSAFAPYWYGRARRAPRRFA